MRIDDANSIGTSTGFGIPTGGTINQVLVKNSSTNYDTTWSSSINLNNLTATGTTSLGTLTSTASTVNGNLTVTGTTSVRSLSATTLNLTTIGSGTSVTNLGITSGGTIVTGSTMVTPTYLAVQNSNGQSISNITVTTVTGWTTPITSVNAGEWNGTTGLFTATKAGVYLMTANLTYASATDLINVEYGCNIAKNGSAAANARIFTQLNQTGNTLKQTNTVSFIYSVVPGDTLSVQAYQASGNPRTLHSNGNKLTIQELPSTITR